MNQITPNGGGTDYIEPHVVAIRNTNKVFYKQYNPPPISVGDIAYWDGSSVKTTPLSSWNTSLGTPVGVVMIPENFLPDGKARIISLNILGEFAWDTTGDSDYNLVNPALSFRYGPTTDNMGSTTYGKYSGYGTNAGLPSDRSYWNGEQSYVDPLSKYYGYSVKSYIPSPYLGDEFNPAYAVELEGGNALSDFNGLSNTQLLVNEGEQYHAAHACWNYKDAANSNLQWYLPAMGELGFLAPRFNLINQSIQTVGGTPIDIFNESVSSSSSQCPPNISSYLTSQWYLMHTTGIVSAYGSSMNELKYRAITKII